MTKKVKQLVKKVTGGSSKSDNSAQIAAANKAAAAQKAELAAQKAKLDERERQQAEAVAGQVRARKRNINRALMADSWSALGVSTDGTTKLGG